MSEALFPYYERELLFIRQMAQDFAKRYPAAAGRLLIEPNRSGDPHIERLIESFALLAARVHHKIDDEFPELTEALLGVMYPHYLAPIPSMAVLQFDLDANRSELPDGLFLRKGTKLQTRPVKELRCKYRTCYPTTLWPVGLSAARLIPPPFPEGLRPPPRTAAVLRLELECTGKLNFSQLSLENLRFYLFGDNQIVPNLYELLFNHVTQVRFRGLDKGTELEPIVQTPEQSLRPVGFEDEEGLLPYPQRSFLGYRLLSEYFAFPNKFYFFELTGLRDACQAGMKKKMEVLLFLNRTQEALEHGIDASTFRLGCTPIVNLFEQTAEPVPLTHARHEYRINPDVAHPHGMEVYSVESVTSANPQEGTETEYQPFYSFRHGVARDSQQAFWHTTRRASFLEGDQGSDVFLNLVDLRFNPRLPADSVLVIRTTCTNRDLPNRLQRAGEEVAFELMTAAPIERIQCLRTPTSTLRPPLKRGAHWRLLSHLNLNHLSLTDTVEGLPALQEILRLYDFSDEQTARQQAIVARQVVEGITGLSSRRIVGRTGSDIAAGFCRGIEVTVEFDEERYIGTGLYLFASVLERFLGLYASLNSFTQLVATTKEGEGILKRWPPRAGDRQLI